MKPKNLDAIYQQYMKDVYRYLRSLCYDHHAAEDLVQETFYRAYLYLEDCKEDKVKPWLFRVAYNAFVDYKRKESRSSTQEPDFFRHHGHSDTPEAAVLRQERWDEFERWVTRLPYKQRQALLLHDFGRLTYQEAAELMGVSLSHYKVLLFRARQQLRKSERKDGEA
ncbi:sigma-70 family RNA polymerase sigma factor [Paenibacillus thalictri]|uniref:Sigma-70 family RNA polymerase sigma factor n=1 Tax=Paenibacillus thalictri TaxID=2527873 RepID=A0A4Q9DRL6_9BACL|nr:sigma-70 family RNA polymerase sigma factor [Paenibacillus thalictri]TBL78525.1 sigma-70 family RNA polymerase sigma factor [Paenibacillus thalictri]